MLKNTPVIITSMKDADRDDELDEDEAELDARNIPFKKRPLTSEEQNKIVNYLSDFDGNYAKKKSGEMEHFKDRLCYYVLIETGLRVGEFCSLRAKNINFQDDHINVEKGKGKKFRKVPMTERVKRLLRTIVDNFKGRIPFGENAVRDRIKKLAHNVGITRKVTPHTLRHTFGVQSVLDDVNLRSLQRVMGHARITTTEGYLEYADKNAVNEILRKVKWD